MSSTVVDFAARLISPAAIKKAGHAGIVAYVAASRPGANFGAKPITKVYADSVKAQGLSIASVYQFGKPGDAKSPSDWTTGYAGGRDHAAKALVNHIAAGGDPLAPIYFAVDENITLAQWNNTAVQFFRGVNDVLSKARTGVYGSSLVCAWAVEDGVIGRSTTTGKFWVWQTRAWSGTEINLDAVLYQRVIDTANAPGPQIDGSAVDVNDVLAADWGQWDLDRTVNVTAVPNFQELNQIGPSSSDRYGARISNFLLHTQEGNGTAESLAGYLNNPANNASYHYTLANGILVVVVPETLASWSVLDANPYTVNLCFAGSRASWSRDQWLAIDRDLQIAAFIAVRSAQAHGYSTDVLAPPYVKADGISDHKYVTQALGIGTHTDVGYNFPWDVFAEYVAQFANGVPVEKPNAINDVAKAHAWLGARITKGENVTPDGNGRWAEFEKGYVYWSPATGAHPIPRNLFAKFAELSWEAGALGYPVTDPKADFSVQAFERGSLYQKPGTQFVALVKGAIKNRWLEEGSETGAFGWPVSDEKVDLATSTAIFQEFEHGRIYWTPKDTLALTNPVKG